MCTPFSLNLPNGPNVKSIAARHCHTKAASERGRVSACLEKRPSIRQRNAPRIASSPASADCRQIDLALSGSACVDRGAKEVTWPQHTPGRMRTCLRSGSEVLRSISLLVFQGESQGEGEKGFANPFIRRHHLRGSGRRKHPASSPKSFFWHVLSDWDCAGGSFFWPVCSCAIDWELTVFGRLVSRCVPKQQQHDVG